MRAITAGQARPIERKDDYAASVRVILPTQLQQNPSPSTQYRRRKLVWSSAILLAMLDSSVCRRYVMWHKYSYIQGDEMVRRSRTDPKSEALRARGSLNTDPKRVTDEVFRQDDFFDVRDMVQVKYEMVRRTEIDGLPASHAAQAFGVSRPTFYAAKTALDSGGIPALVPAKPGPRRAHKLSDEVVDTLEQALAEDPARRAKDLAALAEERFGVSVHPRSVERALARRREKKHR